MVAAYDGDLCKDGLPTRLLKTQSLPIIPEPQTVIFDELFVRSFFRHFLNRCYGNFDDPPSLIPTHKQPIECEIRTIVESEKTLNRRFTVEVFYLCLKRKLKIGCQIGMILS